MFHYYLYQIYLDGILLKSIESLPDISEWIVGNIIDISNMFNNCLSLLSLSDLSKWNFTKVVDMSYIFIDALNKNGCQI